MNQAFVLNTLALLQQCHGCSPWTAIALVQAGIKLSGLPLRYVLKHHIIKDANWVRRPTEAELSAKTEDAGLLLRNKYYKMLIWNDFNQDFNSGSLGPRKVSEEKICTLRQYYLPSSLLSQGFQVYAQACAFQALYVVQHYPQYAASAQAAQFFCEHDPTFTMPLVAAVLNYCVLRNSQHPWLVNIRHGWTPFYQLLASVYLSGMLIVMPQSVQWAYITYAILHLLQQKLEQKATMP